MNNKLIEEMIKSYNKTCPEFTYSNPMLDRNVTKALSKSFVQILKVSKNQNVRIPMLQNIRDLCKSVPDTHVEIDDELTELLTTVYEKQLRESTVTKKDIDKQLDSFLIHRLKTVNTSFQSSVNPEVLQAMLNLDKTTALTNAISNDIVHWNVEDKKTKTVLQNLWDNEEKHEKGFYDNGSIKMKSNLECLLLNISQKILENELVNDENIFLSENDLKSLVNACAISAECFQICIYILNSLFIATNYNNQIEKFIYNFIQNIKSKCTGTVSVLYPVNLSSLVTMLDFSLDELPSSLKDSYVNVAKSYLSSLHKCSQNDLIMLLSHFPLWFNIFFYECFCLVFI